MVMEKLFNGEIYPSEKIHPDSDKYKLANARVGEIVDHFLKKMDEEDKALIEELMTQVYDANSELNYANFKYGFSLGMKLATEVKNCDL